MKLTAAIEDNLNFTLVDDKPVLLVGGEPVDGDTPVECDAATLAQHLAAFGVATLVANAPQSVVAQPSTHLN